MPAPVRYERATRLEALRRLIAQRPPSAVLALADTGLATAMPDSIELDGHPVLECRSGVELVRPADRKALVDGWLRLLETGLSRTPVTLVTGDHATFNFIDLRDVHGTIVGVVVPDADAVHRAELETAGAAAPRLARARRDARGVVVEVDTALPRMLARPVEGLLGHSSVELIVPDDQPSAIGSWMEMLANPGQTHRWRGRYRRGDGSLLWVETVNTNRLADPAQGDILTEFIDISDEMAALEALRASEQLLRRLTDALPEAVIQVDMARRVVHANGRLAEMLGRPAADSIDAQFSETLAADWPRLDRAIAVMLAGGIDADLEVRLALDGDLRVFEFVLRGLVDRAGAPSGGIVCVTDVTERARLRAELEARATFDLQTGCHNRASIMSALQRTLADVTHGSPGTAAVFIDIDRFKAINDQYGHAAGDEVLALVGRRIREVVRADDVVGRLGGDEFLIVCPNAVGTAELRRIGRRLQAVIGRPAKITGRRIIPRASIGIAWLPAGSCDVDRLVAAADEAMYAAKSAGTNRPVIRLIPASPDTQPSPDTQLTPDVPETPADDATRAA